MTDVTLSPVTDMSALAARWRALEAVSRPSPFLTWNFAGRLAEMWFSTPFLLAVRKDGEDLALAMFNQHRGRLYLHATGDAALDGVFIEHNGFLAREGAAGAVAAALDHLVATAPIVIAGVDDTFLAAARAAGLVTRLHTRFAPAVDLAPGLPDDPVPGHIASLSANARAQVRRAMRLCGEGLTIARAPDAATARAWFTDMVALHQQAWEARGKPGAFADPAHCAFHLALVTDGHADDTADMLRVHSSAGTIGVLYNLRRRGHICCYQSGFARYDDPRQKPGLVCHTLAIDFYRSEGATRYDLLAGSARYKTTLAGPGGQRLNWFTLHHRRSITGRARSVAERLATRLRGAIGPPTNDLPP